MRDKNREFVTLRKLLDLIDGCLPRSPEEFRAILFTILMSMISGLVGGWALALVCLGFLLGLLTAWFLYFKPRYDRSDDDTTEGTPK
jgi:hypothetical protein